MKTLLFVLTVLAAAASFGNRAAAQNYPWCAYYGGAEEGENCGFSTHEQCMEAISGMGGGCERNTQYVPPPSAPATPPAPAPAPSHLRRASHRSTNQQ